MHHHLRVTGDDYHELGHAIGIKHHGDVDGLAYLRNQYPNDLNVPMSAPNPHAETEEKPEPLPVVSPQESKRLAKRGPIDQRLSDPWNLLFCAKHGVYSGEAECYMRYTHPPRAIYRIKKGDNTLWEVLAR